MEISKQTKNGVVAGEERFTNFFFNLATIKNIFIVFILFFSIFSFFSHADITYAWTASTRGANVTFTPMLRTIASGTTTFNVVANNGWYITSVTGCGGSFSSPHTYTTGNITSNCTVVANTAHLYTITVGAASGGSTSPSGNVSIGSGSQQNIQLLPNSGYTLGGDGKWAILGEGSLY